MENLLPGLSASPNVHPIFVHFPVALWLVAVGAWWLWLMGRNERAWEFGRWALRIGILGAIAAIITGYFATDALGHHSPGHDLVHTHRNWMLLTSGLALITGIADHIMRKQSDLARRATLIGLLTLTSFTLIVGADRGGELVFRYRIGTTNETPPPPAGHDHHHGDEHPKPKEVAPSPDVEPKTEIRPAKPAAEPAAAPSVTDSPKAPPPKPAVPPGHEGHDHHH